MRNIVALTDEHCAAVAQLHLDCLSTRFSGRSGKNLLSTYYRAVALKQGACGYVGVVHEEISGYVCGVWEPAKLRATLLKTQWSSLALWVPASGLMQPELVASLVKRLGRSAKESTAVPAEGYELRPIVVAPGARGSGLAERLVDQLVFDARSRGFDRMHLFTEIDNQRAQAFYEKVGFVSTGQLQHDGGSVVRYERSLTGA